MRLAPGNPMGRVLMMVLIFEAITIGLAIPVMIMVSGVAPSVAGVAGGAAAILAVVAALLMRKPVGYLLGWITQAAALALALLTLAMLLMGLMFTTLWVVCFVLGRKLDSPRLPM